MVTAMTVQVVTLALQILGFILLALLLFTIQIMGESGRHPLFVNFLVTWVMYSAFVTYDFLGIFTIPQLEQRTFGYTTIIGTEFDIFVLMGSVSTLNLIVYLWFMTWNSLNNGPRFLDRYCIPILLGTPYLTGLVPLLKLWSLINDTTLSYIITAVMILTTLMDVLLLITLFLRRRVLRNAFRKGLISLSLPIKLLAFSLIRVLLCGVSIANGIFLNRFTHGHTNELPSFLNTLDTLLISQSLYPLFVFALFGLHRDILRFWFPCIPPPARRQVTDPECTNTVSGAFTSYGDIVYDIEPAGPPGLASLYNTPSERTASGGATDSTNQNL